MKTPAIRLVVFALFVSILAAPAFGQPVAGIKATVTNFDAGTFMADVDVTAYMDATYPYTTAWIGVPTAFGAPWVPAISWGDGSTVPWPGYGGGVSGGLPQVATSTVISGINVNVYRASYSHAYADAGPHTMTVNSFLGAGTTGSPGYEIVTGNYATYPTYSGFYFYYFISNTAEVGVAAINDIPTASTWGLILLAALLAGSALVILPR